MINIRQELVNFPPVNIEESKGLKIPDEVRNAYVLYNKALDNIRGGSEDIAIIELKKAVSIYPDFHEAMNLLGICYSHVKEYAKAAELFRKVVSLENNSINAMKYLEAMNSGGGSDSRPDSRQKNLGRGLMREEKPAESTQKKALDTIDAFIGNSKGFIPHFIKGLVVGIVLVSVIFAVYLTFFYKVDTKDKNANVPKPPVTKVNDEYKSKFDSLSIDFAGLKEDLEAANLEIDYYKNVTKLFAIEKDISEKNYEKAADSLVLLKTLSFRGDEKERFDFMCTFAIPKAAATVYNDGNRLLSGRKYREAADKYNKLEIYGSNWNYSDSALYNLGKCYISLKDSRNAVDAFQKLIQKYPGSKYRKWSEAKIRELTAVP